MPALAFEQAHLLRARSHIASASARIAQQCPVVARLRASRADTTQAETSLPTMQKALRVMREHKELIEGELAAAAIAPKRRAPRPHAKGGGKAQTLNGKRHKYAKLPRYEDGVSWTISVEVAVSIYGSPEHWQQRAEEVRTAAQGMRDAEARAAMLRVAENYEMIAKRAEARELGIGIPERHRLSA